MSRAAPIVWLLAVVTAACSGGGAEGPSVTEYARQVEHLVRTMDAALEARDLEAEANGPSVEAERARFDGWLAARQEFLEAIRALEPPEAFAELHARAIPVIEDLRDATKALSDVAHDAEDLPALLTALQGAPGQAYVEADARSIQLCLEVQAEFDTTVDESVKFASPWLQAGATQSVEVNLGCGIVRP